MRSGVHGTQPLAILAENGDYVSAYTVDYHGGEQNPHLIRVDGQPDVLSEIVKPQTK